MSARTWWVLRKPCGCPLGILEGAQADTADAAWTVFLGDGTAAAKAAGFSLVSQGSGQFAASRDALIGGCVHREAS